MKHVVALSGGKDSTAMALRLAEIEPREYVYVCTPTGNELPEMWEHWRRLGDLLGKPLTPVIGGTLKGLIEKQNALPNWRQRWCTRMLKIEPYAAWLAKQGHAVSYVGLRADEEERQGGDYARDIPGVTMRYPMREWGWTLQTVRRYLDMRGIMIPRRTDCAWCFWQQLGEWWNLWRDHPAAYGEAERMEAVTGHTFRSAGRDTWPVSLKDLRGKFEAGHIPRSADIQGSMLPQLKCRVCRL